MCRQLPCRYLGQEGWAGPDFLTPQVTLQVMGQGCAVGVTLLRILLQGLKADVLQGDRYLLGLGRGLAQREYKGNWARMEGLSELKDAAQLLKSIAGKP